MIALLLTAALAAAPIDDYQCSKPEGCDALNTASGNVVTFRKGDVVSTERGFVVAGDDLGWVPIDLMDQFEPMLDLLAYGSLANVYECVAEKCCATIDTGPFQKLLWTLKEGVVISTTTGWIKLPANGWKKTTDFNPCL